MSGEVEAQELAEFRTETHEWLAENCPPGARSIPLVPENIVWGGRKPFFPNPDLKIWLERMAERGWTVPEWPSDYGGGGLDPLRAKVLAEELARIDAHKPLQSLGIIMLGPALLQFGTEAQKREHLPKIARGEVRWAQGYSEPGAGSDLASLRTRAEDRGDHFVVNGQKIWTSYGHHADMIFALVRTDPDAPKHLGISFLLIDMDQPGVLARPIRQISGNENFSETFFDDAVAPKKYLVGTLNCGWDVAKYLLTFERASMGKSIGAGKGEKLHQRVLRILGKEGLARDPALRQEIAESMMQAWSLEIAGERLFDEARSGQENAFSGSVLKLLGTELDTRRTRAIMSLGGFDHLDNDGSEAYSWLDAPTNCIAGGSNEVQLNILAKRALGLPQD